MSFFVWWLSIINYEMGARISNVGIQTKSFSEPYQLGEYQRIFKGTKHFHNLVPFSLHKNDGWEKVFPPKLKNIITWCS